MRSARLRRSAAVVAADVTSRATRITGRHGTALPGLVATRIDPSILAALGAGLTPIVLVIGTNGKTTTTRLTAAVLERALGVTPVSNRSGANLAQGLVTAILADRRPGAGPRPAVFEVDELAFPEVARVLQPAVVVMLNLVRDQLDRYGEVDTVERRWTEALAVLPPSATLVVCADDPRLEAIVGGVNLRVRRFGLIGDLSAIRHDTGIVSSAEAVGAPCPACGAKTAVGDASASIGAWRCGSCGFSRPELDLGVGVTGMDGEWLGLAFEPRSGDDIGPVSAGDGSADRLTARVGLTGTAGAHDAAAAVLAATSLGVSLPAAVAGLDGATPAFGRLEEIAVDGRRVVLTLTKNPASAAQATEAVAERRPDAVLIGLGDRAADGRDVSWIWDARLEHLLDLAPLTLTGDRAEDLAVRFKYAERSPDDQAARPVVDPALEHALESSIARVRPGGTLMVLGTYTTLLGIRQVLERRGLATTMPR